MPRDRDRDEFEGIDISGPWGGVRFGAGGWRRWDDDEDDDARHVRQRVRQKLDFYRHLLTFAMVVGGLALINWVQVRDDADKTWWVLWVAGIWGAFVLVQFFTTFISPTLWGRDAEERMVQRELERHRRRVGVDRARIDVGGSVPAPPEPPRPPV